MTYTVLVGVMGSRNQISVVQLQEYQNIFLFLEFANFESDMIFKYEDITT